ncbi:hypothetical protein ACLOJK_019135 [Asimina triloba]
MTAANSWVDGGVSMLPPSIAWRRCCHLVGMMQMGGVPAAVGGRRLLGGCCRLVGEGATVGSDDLDVDDVMDDPD